MIDSLNKKFGAPGRIVFAPSTTGAPIVSLANQYGSCEVSMYGAQVLSYRPTGHAPVFYMSRRATFAPGKGIRGGVPVCWPCFGKPTDPKLPKHGFARTATWDVLGTSYSEEATELQLILLPTPEMTAMFPHAFKLRLTVTLGRKLTIALTTLNCDTTPFTITEGLHPYYRVSNIQDVSVRGVDGCDYIYAETQEHFKQSGDLTIPQHTDHVFAKGTGEAVIMDNKLNRALATSFRGNGKVVIWNPWADHIAELGDCEDEDYRAFLCVEPASLYDATVTIAPGEQHTLSLAVQSVLKGI